MSTVVVDSRLRQRRIEVARAAGRRRLRRLVVLAGLVLAAGGVWLALHSPLLDVDSITVTGAERTSVTDLLAAAGIETGLPIVDVDTARVAEQLESLPWIAQASVRRSWSGAVEISVIERHPVATIAADDGWGLVDAEGAVAAVAAVRPADLPAVVADDVASPAPGGTAPLELRPALRVAAMLPERIRVEVQAVLVDDGGDLSLLLEGGGRAVLGTTEDLDLKLIAVATILDAASGPLRGILDVRVPRVPILDPVRGEIDVEGGEAVAQPDAEVEG